MYKFQKSLIIVVFLVLLTTVSTAFAGPVANRLLAAGWSKQISVAVEQALATAKEPVVAIFDHDGTVMYGDLSGGDEKNQPGLLTELIKQRKLKKAGMAQVPAAYKKQPNHYFESLLRKDVNAAYTWRVKVLAGYTRNQLLTIAQKAYLAVYRHYVYSQMQTMIDVLHENKAIIHLVSAGPEILIKGCADTLGVPVERIHGQRFHVKNGKILPEIDEPHTYGIGKVWCIQNVVKPSPTAKLLVFGNSYSNDGFMLRYALRRGGVAVIINPADRKIKSVKRDRFMIQRFERKKLRALIFPKLEL